MGYELAKDANMMSDDEVRVVCQSPQTGALAIVYLIKLKDENFKRRLGDQYSAVMFIGQY